MSREEAIKNIKRLWMMSDMTDEYGEMIDSEPFEESVKMAIEALEQEPCDDTVSIRKDVLKCRVGKLVVYNVEWLKKHWQMEMDIVCGVKPCDDVVSREDAIAEINDTIAGYIPFFDGRTAKIPLELAKAIMRVPSVTQKSGKWIKVKSGDKDFPESIVCSRCNNENSHLDFNENAEPIGKVFVTSKFCPNCGACMKDGRTLDEFIEDSKESGE